MARMARRSVVAVAVAASLSVLVPATGDAAVTIGSNLSGDGDANCFGFCTETNLSLPSGSTASNGLVSPINGVVVRWRVKSGSAGRSVTLRVLRQGGGTSFTGLRTGTSGTTTGSTDTFGARSSIGAGDSIGLNVADDALVLSMNPLATALSWSGGLADGLASPGTSTNAVLLVQADVEPDADRDGFGDETQDGCPGDSTRQTPPCSTGTTNAGATPPATPGDRTPPTISSLRMSPASFHLGRTARVSFRVSEIAAVKLAFARLVPGRRRGTRCLPQSRTVHTGRRCTAAVSAGSVSLRAQRTQSIPFDGRVTRSLLAPGRYRITATARDLAGNASRQPVTTTFNLLPRIRRR